MCGYAFLSANKIIKKLGSKVKYTNLSTGAKGIPHESVHWPNVFSPHATLVKQAIYASL